MYSAEDLYTESDDLEVVHEPQDEDNAEVQDDPGSGNEDENAKTVIKPKRVVRNPQPKLDVEALKGPKGLLCLEGYFKNKKYRGKGHEDEDLRSIMKTYEYWCHRLFPKFPFDECISKLEKLGTKKTVQTYVKRIRMNLVEDEERRIVSDDDDERQPVAEVETHFNDLQESLVVDESPQLTVDQLERIRMNKEKANQLRLERLQRAKQKAIILTNTSGTLEKRQSDVNEFDVVPQTQTVVALGCINEKLGGVRGNCQYKDKIEITEGENVCDSNVNNEVVTPSDKIQEEIAADTVKEVSIANSNEISQHSKDAMVVNGTIETLNSDGIVAEDEIEESIAMECD